MPVYRDKRRGTYYYSFRKDGKQVRSKDFTNRKDCDKALAVALLKADKIASETYTFNQVAFYFFEEQEKKLKPQSVQKCRENLSFFLEQLGNIRVDRLTIKHYSKALDQLDKYVSKGKPLSNSYKNKLIKTFKQLCKFADKRFDLRTDIPAKFDNYKNEPKKEMQILTPEEFSRLFLVIDNPCYRALFTMLFYMGFRIGEANALQWKDIDFEKNTISITKTVNTKIRAEDGYMISTPKTPSSIRTLPMPRSVSERLLFYRDKLPIEKENLSEAFVFGLAKPLAESTIQQAKNKYLKKAGLPPMRLHDFRHSCASYLINKNATPLLVSKWLGHASVTMTLDVYSHLWKSELDQLVQVMDADQ